MPGEKMTYQEFAEKYIDRMDCRYIRRERKEFTTAGTKYRVWFYHFELTLHHSGAAMTTDYQAGEGIVLNAFRKAAQLPRSSAGKTIYEDESLENYLQGKHRESTLGNRLLPAYTPEVADVLMCLTSDADAINFSSFEEWAEEFGFDADSRKAEAIYNQCIGQALRLRRFLGSELFEQLRECEEE